MSDINTFPTSRTAGMAAGRGTGTDSSTILIVDDEPWGREALAALLKTQGYNLVFAENGIQALSTARMWTPDLVLLDVMMPDMDGFAVCQAMRSDPNLADVPILMVTALDDRNSRLRGIEAGADDFIAKPFDRIELRTRVQTITRLNRYRRIQAERTKFQWVVERAEEGYLLLDEDGYVVYMNTQARHFLQVEGELNLDRLPLFLELARTHYQFEPSGGWSSWPAPAKEGNPLFLVRPETVSSSAFWLQVDSIALPPGSGPGILIQLLNVTDRINMIREQRTFHALINHRLRTPVTMMLMGLETMELDEETHGELAAILEIVQRGALRLRTDVEEVLAYLDSPGPSGRETGLVLGELASVIQAVVDDLDLARVEWTLPSDANHVQLSLSSRFVEIALLEILENALKFHPRRDPTIHIEITLPTAGFVRISVRDDGIHLAPDQLAKVWNPYYQAEKGFSGQVEGLGLGLSTVSSIVWGVGGRCQMSNRNGLPGVEVALLLPIANKN